LVLRNSSDEGIEKTQGRYVAELYGTARKPAAPASAKPAVARKAVVMVAPPVAIPIAPPPPPAPDQIVVIRGNTKTVEVIPRGN